MQWDEGKDNFAIDPPNATVSVLGGDGSDVSDAVVTLKTPKLEGTTLTFDVAVLEGNLDGTDGPAAVFIENFRGGSMAAASMAATRMSVTPPSPMSADGMAGAMAGAATGTLRFTMEPGMAAQALQRAWWLALPLEPRRLLLTMHGWLLPLSTVLLRRRCAHSTSVVLAKPAPKPRHLSKFQTSGNSHGPSKVSNLLLAEFGPGPCVSTGRRPHYFRPDP